LNFRLVLYEALVGANVPSDQARAVVEALEHEMYTVLATKSDLAASMELFKEQLARYSAEIRQEMAEQNGLMRKEFYQQLAATSAGLRQELGGQIASSAADLRSELSEQIASSAAGIRAELGGQMAAMATKEMIQGLATKEELKGLATQDQLTLLRKDMELLRASMTIRLGSMQAVGLGVLFAALKLT